ncbi:hypothetical protein F0562_024317 [Nyssa sinensis]|uniref:DYW domain-containing protein n=1 Tax=Nyssa sinensis TaxID=561372 RepID=A0A5J5BDM7_9ASTE|nr:hypothetical protein F0562_024317 [Nyssa sinensis]
MPTSSKPAVLHNPAVAENFLESAAILLPEPMDYALSIFRKIDEPNSPAYNIMIRGFTSKQSPHEAIVLFKQMCETSVQPDDFTFPCILKACSRLQALNEGKQIHAQIIKCGFGSSGIVENTLIHMYGNCGEVEVARCVFDGMSERGVITWNSMFAGYTKSSCWEEVVELFRKMLELDVRFDEVTLVSVLTACGRVADLELGQWISEYIEANGLKGNPTLVTSLVDMYAKCGHVDTARSSFDQMPRRDVVAWSAMISGYSQASRCREALALFHEMQKANVGPNEITMVSVLSSCSVLGALETGKWVHSYIKKRGMKLTATLGTALVDFYAKCGSIDSSIEVFKGMPSKNVLSWTVLIQGLVNEGWGFFVSMSRDFDIEPRIEHYGCMVDILGRAGLIEEGISIHKKHAHQTQCCCLENIVGFMWEDALRVRSQMKEKGIKKMPGCSMIELDGVIHEFFAEDNVHPQSEEIYNAIENMMQRIKLAGYMPNIAEARLDAEEDDKEASVSHHSEKLAIAFGLIRTSPGTTIRISKNLRVCTDCHNATKMISKVFHREIVVRDRNRFHHFKDGSCSCNDYW